MIAYGLMRKRPDLRDYRFTPPDQWNGSTPIDISGDFPERPYDQGWLGSCVSQGTAGAADLARVRMGLTPMDRPSRLFLYYEGRRLAGYPIGRDTGLQIRDGFNALAKSGAAHEQLWPYEIERFADRPNGTTYADGLLNQAIVYGSVDASQIDDAIASGYGVVFGFDVYESFEATACASTGVMPAPNKTHEQFVGGHCMVFTSTPVPGTEIKGADPRRRYRKARNSWGTSWGIPEDPGHVWFPTDEVDNGDSSDFWVVTTMEDPGAPEPPRPVPDYAALVAAVEGTIGDAAVMRWLGAWHCCTTRRAVDRLTSIINALPEV
jgi:hypothetical protein